MKSDKTVKTESRRKTPLIVRWLRFSLRAQALISKRWAGRRVYRLWFVSPKHPEPQREKRWRESAAFIAVPHRYGPIATYKWGESDKTVLLLHGWSGRGPQMGAFVEPLLARGYQLVAIDAPGHGRTPGNRSSIFRMNAALQAVIEEVGPVEAVITHSFGAMLLAYALKHTDFNTNKAVCISSPTTPHFLIDRFCSVMQVDDKVKQHFMRHAEQQYGQDVWDKLSAHKNVQDIRLPALIIHDQDDHDVPSQFGQQLADAWAGSQFHLTRGLGHRRILRNKEVINRVVDYLYEKPGSESSR